MSLNLPVCRLRASCDRVVRKEKKIRLLDAFPSLCCDLTANHPPAAFFTSSHTRSPQSGRMGQIRSSPEARLFCGHHRWQLHSRSPGRVRRRKHGKEVRLSLNFVRSSCLNICQANKWCLREFERHSRGQHWQRATKGAAGSVNADSW